MRRKIVVLFIFILAASTVAWAASHMAASVSYSDVSAAVSAASSGDAVIVPPGTATWSSTLKITKGITLQGAGIDKTVINSSINNKSSSPVWYAPASPALNESFLLAGFTFNGSKMSTCVNIENTSDTPVTKVRVCYCKFTGGNYIGLNIIGPVYGVADHNQYVAQEGDDTQVLGHDQRSYDHQTASFGTGDAFFFEDSTFDGTGGAAGSAIFQNSNGAQFVFRHNIVSNWKSPGILDLHGNTYDPVVPGYTEARAPLNGEVYGNIFHSTRGASGPRWMYHRGGALLMYDNTIDGCTNAYIYLTEEDAWFQPIIPAICTHGGEEYICLHDHTSAAATEPGVGASWTTYWAVTSVVPHVYITWMTGILFRKETCYDPIVDTYYYSNTNAGADVVPVNQVPATDNLYVDKNTNWWNLDPRGRTIKGAIYQPYEYPHPLQQGSPSTVIGAPSGLRIQAP